MQYVDFESKLVPILEQFARDIREAVIENILGGGRKGTQPIVVHLDEWTTSKKRFDHRCPEGGCTARGSRPQDGWRCAKHVTAWRRRKALEKARAARWGKRAA
jgi:hypothetical protein